MNIQKLECPNCHAGLDSDYGNEGIFFCKYCGQKIIVEEIQNAEYDLKMRKMEMEHEEKKIAMDQQSKNIRYAYESESQAMDNAFRTKMIIICMILIIFCLSVLFAMYIIV